MVEIAWIEVENRFPGIALDEFIVMPDHFHGILALHGERKSVNDLNSNIGWFKTVTTKRYGVGVGDSGWPVYSGTLWQRSYYDHMVRNESDLIRCRNYAISNPGRWLEKNGGN